MRDVSDSELSLYSLISLLLYTEPFGEIKLFETHALSRVVPAADSNQERQGHDELSSLLCFGYIYDGNFTSRRASTMPLKSGFWDGHECHANDTLVCRDAMTCGLHNNLYVLLLILGLNKLYSQLRSCHCDNASTILTYVDIVADLGSRLN